MSDEKVEFLYRDLDANLRAILIEMSNWGFIYLGRTGAGLTYSFRRAYFKMGTKAIRTEAAKYIGDDGLRILQLIAIEGPKWVPYKRVEDAYYNIQPFQAVSRERASATIKKKNNKKKPPSDEEIMEELRKAMINNSNNKKKKNKEKKSLS